MNYEVHPVAAMFPMIPEGSQQWNDLLDSIREIGQLDAAVLDGDILLDGRNRLRACEVLGIRPKFVQWSTLGIRIAQDEWISAKNFDRRHLTDDQRAQIGYEINAWQARQEAGKNKNQYEKVPDTNSCPAKKHDRSTVGQIANKAGVSHHKVRQAAAVEKAVESGELPTSVRENVKAGKTKLVDAVAAIPSKEKKATPLKERVEKKWRNFLGGFASSELPRVKKIVSDLCTL